MAQKGQGGRRGEVAQENRQRAGQRAHTEPRELSLGPSRSQYSILRPKLSTWTTRSRNKTNHFHLPGHLQLQPMTALFHSTGYKVCRSHERMGAEQWPKRAIQLSKEPDSSLVPPQPCCVVVWAAGTATDLLISSINSCITSLHTRRLGNPAEG